MVSTGLFLSDRKMELSSGKLARFADGAAVVQVKNSLRCGELHFLVGHQGVQRSSGP